MHSCGVDGVIFYFSQKVCTIIFSKSGFSYKNWMFLFLKIFVFVKKTHFVGSLHLRKKNNLDGKKFIYVLKTRFDEW